MFLNTKLFAWLATFSAQPITALFHGHLRLKWTTDGPFFIVEFYLKTAHFVFLWLIIPLRFKLSATENQKLIRLYSILNYDGIIEKYSFIVIGKYF